MPVPAPPRSIPPSGVSIPMPTCAEPFTGHPDFDSRLLALSKLPASLTYAQLARLEAHEFSALGVARGTIRLLERRIADLESENARLRGAT